MQIIASHIVKLSAYIRLLIHYIGKSYTFCSWVAEGDKGYIQKFMAFK